MLLFSVCEATNLSRFIYIYIYFKYWYIDLTGKRKNKKETHTGKIHTTNYTETGGGGGSFRHGASRNGGGGLVKRQNTSFKFDQPTAPPGNVRTLRFTT